MATLDFKVVDDQSLLAEPTTAKQEPKKLDFKVKSDAPASSLEALDFSTIKENPELTAANALTLARTGQFSEVASEEVDPNEDSLLDAIGKRLSNAPLALAATGHGIVEFVATQPLRSMDRMSRVADDDPDNDPSRIGAAIGAIDDLTMTVPSLALNMIAPEFVQNAIDSRRELQERIAANQPNVEPGSVKDIISSGVGAVTEQAPGITASVLLRNPGPALAQAGGQSFINRYYQNLEAGENPEDAILAGIGSATAETALEKIPLTALLREGTPFVKRLVEVTAGEFVTEGATELADSLIDYATINPDITFGEALDRAQQAGLISLVAGPLNTTGAVTIDGIRNRVVEPRVSAQIAQEAADTKTTDERIQQLLKPNEQVYGGNTQYDIEARLRGGTALASNPELLNAFRPYEVEGESPQPSSQSPSILGNAVTSILGGGNNISQDVVETGLDNPQPDIQSATTGREAFVSIVQDRNEAVKSQFGRAVSDPEAAQDFYNRVEQNTRSGAMSQTKFTMDTGFFPNGIKTDSLTSVTRATKQLSPAERVILYEGLIAADVKDSRRIAAAKTGKDVRPSATAWSDADIDARISALEASPRLLQLSTSLKNISDATLKYLASPEVNVISQETYNDLRSKRPNFVPNIGVNADGSINMGILGDLDVGQDYSQQVSNIKSLLERNTEEATGVQNFLNPVTAVDHYMTTLIPMAQKKALQREFVDAVINSSDPELANSVKRIDDTKAQQSFALLNQEGAEAVASRLAKNFGILPETVLGIKRGDKTEYYQFADPLIAQSLKFAPNLAKSSFNNILRTVRRLKQEGITGRLNPLFSVKSFFYDASTIAVRAAANKGNRKIGPLDAGLQWLSGGAIGNIGDPSIYVANLSGVPRVMSAELLNNLSSRIEASLRSQSGIFSTLPPEFAADIATRMRDAYMNSSVGLLERSGGFNTSLLYDSETKIARLLRLDPDTRIGRMVSDIPVAGPVVDSLLGLYNSILGSIHNAGRVSYFARNLTKQQREAIIRTGRIPKEVRQLAQEAREVGIDFGRQGLGNDTPFNLSESQSARDKFYATLAKGSNRLPLEMMKDGMLFFNVGVQGIGQMAGPLLTRDLSTTARMATAMTTTIGIPLVVSLAAMAELDAADEEQQGAYSDYYWNQMPAWMRTSTIYVPIPGERPEDGLHLPISPEFHAIKSMMEGGLDSAFGFSNGRIVDNDMLDVRQGLRNLAPGFEFPLVSAFLAAGGQEMATDLEGNFTIQDIRTEGISGLDESRRVNGIMSANTEAIVSSIFGVAGESMVSMLEAGLGELDESDGFLEGTGEFIDAARQQAVFDQASRAVGREMLGYGKVFAGTDANLERIRKEARIREISKVLSAQSDPTKLEEVGEVPNEPTNPDFLANAGALRKFINSKAYRGLQDYKRLLDKRLQKLKSDLPMDKQKLERINEVQIEANETSRQMYQEIIEFEKATGISIDDMDPFDSQ